jgi:arsenite methyltransferase
MGQPYRRSYQIWSCHEYRSAPGRRSDMSMLQFDENGARHILRLYSTPDVVQQRAKVLALLAAQPGERVLDIGSGPGFLVASLADAVGASGAVYGLDPSAPMNAVARDVIGTRPWARIDDGDALELPYADGAFDAAVSTQVYEYVADIPRALSELRRVLRLGGRALVLDTDWDSVVWHVADRQRHRRVMAAWEEHLVHPHLPCTLPGHLRRARFRVTGRHLIPLFNSSFEPNTFSALNMEMIARFVSGRQGLTDEDVDAWMADLRERGAEDDYLYSVNRYCFLAVAQ